MSHLGPVFPEEQRHLPVTWSHAAAPSQLHTCAQPPPKVPCSHTGTRWRGGWGQEEGSAAVVVIGLVRLTSVAASAAVSRGTDALAGCRVTGSSVCAVTLQLAGRTVETRRTSWGRRSSTSAWFDNTEMCWKKRSTLLPLTVLTLTSVVTRAAAARPRHPVTSAVVPTVAFELAVGAKHACGTF